MREEALSAFVWTATVGLVIADAEGFRPARYLIAVLVLIWLASVAVPWIVNELGPPWRRRQ